MSLLPAMPPPVKIVGPKALCAAWRRYAEIFGDVPHGTERQMAALLEFVPRELEGQ